MLFITYWEINEQMSAAERLQTVGKLAQSGLFPPQGVNILRWDATPDGWGTLLVEAENEAAIHRAIAIWRAASTGFLKFTKTAPAQPVQDAVAVETALLQALAAA